MGCKVQFLFIYKLTKLCKFNNMQFMSLNMLYDFIQVIYSIQKHYSKVDYFPKHILFITTYIRLN
jgi:hypothetical protein